MNIKKIFSIGTLVFGIGAGLTGIYHYGQHMKKEGIEIGKERESKVIEEAISRECFGAGDEQHMAEFWAERIGIYNTRNERWYNPKHDTTITALVNAHETLKNYGVIEDMSPHIRQHASYYLINP